MVDYRIQMVALHVYLLHCLKAFGCREASQNLVAQHIASRYHLLDKEGIHPHKYLNHKCVRLDKLSLA